MKCPFCGGSYPTRKDLLDDGTTYYVCLNKKCKALFYLNSAGFAMRLNRDMMRWTETDVCIPEKVVVNMRKYKIGDRIELIKNGSRGIIIGYNLYHENYFNITFDNGVTVNNIHGSEVDVIRKEAEKVIFT